MKKCVMCHQLFVEVELDWCGRCEPCFRKYLDINDWEKPGMSLPYTPTTPPGA